MIGSPETRPNPSTPVLERELDLTENILGEALANVAKVSGFSGWFLYLQLYHVLKKN